MSEVYKGYSLNDTGDANWGPTETTAFKLIIDKLPTASQTIVGAQHVHSSLVAAGGVSGSGTALTIDSVKNVAINSSNVTICGSALSLKLTDTAGGTTAVINENAGNLTLSPSLGSNHTVSLCGGGLALGVGSPCSLTTDDVTQKIVATANTTSLTVDGTASRVLVVAANGLQSNSFTTDGTDIWVLGPANAGVPPSPDTAILVKINNATYAILAQAI